VYAAEGTALLQSTDAGKDWGPLTYQPPILSTLVACVYDTSAEIVVSNSDTIEFTTNSGSTWSIPSFGTGGDYNLPTAIASSPQIGNTSRMIMGRTYYGTSEKMVAYSVDHGANWTNASTPSVNGTVFDIAMNPGGEDPGYSVIAFAHTGVSNDTARGLAFNTTYGSASWDVHQNVADGYHCDFTAVALWYDKTSPHVADLVFAGTADGRLLSGTWEGTKLTAVSGWTQYSTDTVRSIKIIMINPSTPTYNLYVATDRSVWESTNGGSSFITVSSGMPDSRMYALVPVDPVDPDTDYFVAGSHTQLYYTATSPYDGWSLPTGFTTIPAVYSAAPYGSTIVSLSNTTGVTDGTTNSGSSWTAQRLQSPTNSFYGLTSAICYAGSGGRTVFQAGIMDSLSNSSPFYYSTSTSLPFTYGEDAQFASKDNARTYVEGIVTDPVAKDKMYAFGNIEDGDGNYHLFYSNQNYGAVGQWDESVSNGLGFIAFCLAPKGDTSTTAPYNSQTFFAGYQYGLAYSTDGGNTWGNSIEGTGPIVSVAWNPVNALFRAYAGGKEGLARSDNAWWEYPNGPPTFTTKWSTAPVVKVVIDPRFLAAVDSSYDVIWATSTQLYRASDAAQGTPLNVTGAIPSTVTINDLRTDPTDTTLLYVGTSGGVYKIKLMVGGPNVSPVGGVAVNPPFTLKWNSNVSASNYHLQISTNSTYSGIVHDTVVSGSTDTTYYFYNAAQCTQYYWHVLDSNATWQASPWSQTSTFTTDVSPGVLTLYSPAFGATGVPACPPPSLSWTSSVNGQPFHVEVDTIRTMTTGTLIVNDSPYTSTSLSVGPLTDGRWYYWRVAQVTCMGEGSWSAVDSFQTQISPTLLSPANNSTDVSICSQTEFEWNEEYTNTLYKLEISTSSTFSGPGNMFRDTMFLYPTGDYYVYLKGNTTYYWRVLTGGCGDTVNGWSATWQLSTGDSIPMATMNWPNNGRINIGWNPAPTVEWTSSGSVDSDRIQLSDTSDFAITSRIKEDTTISVRASLTLDNILLTRETYYWRMEAHNKCLGWSSWDSTFDFTTSGDAYPVNPILLSPANGTTNFTSGVLVWYFANYASTYTYVLSLTNSPNSPVISGTTPGDTTANVYNKLSSNTTYYWFVKDSNKAGNGGWDYQTMSFTTGTINPGVTTFARHPDEFLPHSVAPSQPKPTSFSLSQNYPNPFNPTTTISYALPTDVFVNLRIYNVLGQVVKTLVNEEQSAGYKSAVFNATDLPSGLYFYRLAAGSFIAMKKLLLIK
jgi:hypothetical protein